MDLDDEPSGWNSELLNKVRHKDSVFKARRMRTHQGEVFNGGRIRQMPNGAIKIQMDDLHRGNGLPDPGQPRAEEEQRPETWLPRGNCLSGGSDDPHVGVRQLGCDMLGPTSILTRKVSESTVEEIWECNRIADLLGKTKEFGIVPHPVKTTEAIRITVADASPTPLEKLDPKARGCFMVAIGQARRKHCKAGHLNMVLWRSGKADRECASSLAAGTHTMVAACSSTEPIVSMHDGLIDGARDSKSGILRVRRWNKSTPSDTVEEQRRGMVILPEQKRKPSSATFVSPVRNPSLASCRGKQRPPKSLELSWPSVK